MSYIKAKTYIKTKTTINISSHGAIYSIKLLSNSFFLFFMICFFFLFRNIHNFCFCLPVLVTGTQSGWYVIGRLVRWPRQCGGMARFNVKKCFWPGSSQTLISYSLIHELLLCTLYNATKNRLL